MNTTKKNFPKRIISVLLMIAVVLTAVPAYSTNAEAASNKYKKYKGTWVSEGDPAVTVKISSVSSSKIKLKFQIWGGITNKNGYVSRYFRDSTKTVTKKLKKGQTSFTVKTKKGYKLKVKVKLANYRKISGSALGVYFKIKSSQKLWNTGSIWQGTFKH